MYNNTELYKRTQVIDQTFMPYMNFANDVNQDVFFLLRLGSLETV